MSNINDLFDCFDDNIGFENENETRNPVVINEDEETNAKYIRLNLIVVRFSNLLIYFCETGQMRHQVRPKNGHWIQMQVTIAMTSQRRSEEQ